MEKKFLNLEIKAEGENSNKITGYGSVFGHVDQGDDVVVQGAFAKSLASGRKPKMLFNHNHNEVIGTWTSVVEDEKGLRVEGVLANTPRGQEVKELIKIKAIEGLSIAYRLRDYEYNAAGHRLLKELSLAEVSVVTFPMLEVAQIDAVKAATLSKREMEHVLRDAGMTKSVAQALLSGGYDALQSKRDADDVAKKEMEEIAALLKARFS
ncbi:HK97 family phage prohead protease [Paracoccus sp. (in: a-proteobacteria)]|uniref:HK97 family phage prohead protease n=1 Tax=Paracoccus sp. TaxID=267 RepID=UPI004058239E